MEKEFINVFSCDVLGSCSSASMTLSDLTRLKHEWNLPISDMRIFLRSKPASSGVQKDDLPSSILSRPSSQCFLVNLEHVRLLCRKDVCLVLHSDDTAVKQFVDDLRKHLVQGSPQVGGNRDYSNMHAILELFTGQQERKLEFAVMETTLAAVTNKFKKHLALLKPILDILLQETLTNPSTAMLRRMLAFMKNLNAFEMSVSMARSAVADILEEDEDLVGLCLSDGETDMDKMELLLEAYSSDLKELECELANIKEQIEDTNDFMNIHLNTIRNSFMKMSMIMEMGTLAVGLGAMVAGFFGMNVPNRFEDSNSSFTVITTTTVAVISLIGLAFLVFVRRYSTLNKDFSSAISFHSLTNFFNYAREVEHARLVSDDWKSDLNKKEFRKALEPILGQKLKGQKLRRAFRVLFPENENKGEKRGQMPSAS